jgi:hypothetical protein
MGRVQKVRGWLSQSSHRVQQVANEVEEHAVEVFAFPVSYDRFLLDVQISFRPCEVGEEIRDLQFESEVSLELLDESTNQPAHEYSIHQRCIFLIHSDMRLRRPANRMSFKFR